MIARAVTLLAFVAAGCGYTSEYAPPADGRARPVWRENRVEVSLGGVPVGPECAQALRDASGGRLQLPPPPRGYTPRYYGPQIVVVTPGIAPPPPHVLFAPRLVPSLRAPLGPLFPIPSGGGSLGGGGGGKGAEYLLLIALIVLPVVDLALAIADPEDVDRSTLAIDQVNAYNDLARLAGSPCALAYGGAQ